MAIGGGIKRLVERLGLSKAFEAIYGGQGSILVFHRVRPPRPDPVFDLNRRNIVDPAHFTALLEVLHRSGIAVVSLDEAMGRLAMPRRAGRFVCLTFDDGYRDNRDVVLPIAERFGVPFTVYVAPGLIDGTAPLWWYALDEVLARADRVRLPLGVETVFELTGPDSRRAAFAAGAEWLLRAPPADVERVCAALAEQGGPSVAALAATHMMSWAQVRAMARSPLVTIGAHTMSHPALRRLDEAAARDEMVRSRERLAFKTGRAVDHFAYPFGTDGAVGPREVALAAELGFRTAVTAHPGNLFSAHLRAPHALPRHGVGPEDGPASLRLKLAGISRRPAPPWRPAVTRPLASP